MLKIEPFDKYFNIRLILFLVIVHGKPGKPGGVSASNLDSQSGKVIWTDGTIYGKEISSYRIDGRTNHNSTWVTLADRVRYGINIRDKIFDNILECEKNRIVC